MLTIVFETHATSLDNEAGLASGWFDVDLSPAGEAQARALGERRGADAIAAVHCSDLRRTRRTAQIAFAERGVPIVVDARLRECDYGDLTRQPAASLDPRERYIDAVFPGGESLTQAVQRVARWLDDARDVHAGATILVIGHRATFYAFEHLLRGVPLRDAVRAPWTWQPGWTYDA
jgi:2,3-bisphosphoglycerate-dependent phosphoglycerate mutase